MKVYKIRDRVTGLYYGPCLRQLHKDGKVYARLAYVRSAIGSNHLNPRYKDAEIVEFEITETNILPIQK